MHNEMICSHGEDFMHMGRTLCTQGTHKKDNTHGDIFPGYDAHFLYTIMEVSWLQWVCGEDERVAIVSENLQLNEKYPREGLHRISSLTTRNVGAPCFAGFIA